MRVWSRVALVVIAVFGFIAIPAHASHLVGDCPLSLTGTTPPSSDFDLSPHGVFRTGTTPGSLVYVLRGQTLSTYSVTDLGDMQQVREDFIGSLANRDSSGGVTYSNGFLYVSGDSGLEIFDIRTVGIGSDTPSRAAQIPGVHYRKLAVSGNLLAALFPATDMACVTAGTTACYNVIDLYNVTDPNNPRLAGSITSLRQTSPIGGFNDIAFNQGYLYATGPGGTIPFNVSNPALAYAMQPRGVAGKWLVSNGTNLLAVGNAGLIDVYSIGVTGSMGPIFEYSAPFETINRSNPIMFHPEGAYIDDQGGRLVTLIDEMDPQTLQPARTIAFDVFDFSVPMWQGSDPRVYENVSYVTPDEVKYDPVVVGSNVYVVGSMNGMETYGACGSMAGAINWNGLFALTCGGSEIRGWVSGSQKVTNVELLMDTGSLGTATLGGPPPADVSSQTPVQTWRIAVNLDQTTRGEHILRAIGTDANGVRRQFASQRIFFNGPGQNCTNRRRATAH